MKKTKKNRKLILEGAGSAIDISGTFYFNTHRDYNANDNLQQVWINVGKYLDSSICKIDSDKKELIVQK